MDAKGRKGWVSLVVFCAAVAAAPGGAFDVPLYVNMGGPEFVDSSGRLWLGDEGANADPLGIRPDDLGGGNTIGNWCSPSAASMAALPTPELNPTVKFAASDAVPFQSIRWDAGGDASPYRLQIPVPPGSYTVCLYFCENCCPNRHEKVTIQGELRFPDVHTGSYAGGATQVPGLLYVEDVLVGEDGILDILLEGCLQPECPGGTDGNPVLSALAVVPTGYDVCSKPGFRACPGGLACSVDAEGTVTGSWSPPVCFAAAGYEVYQDDALVATLPASATAFSVVQEKRYAEYRVKTLLPEGEAPCPDVACAVTRPEVPFEAPLRINMGGRTTVDSQGRRWLGDGPGPGDALSIRPEDRSATNWIESWCPQLALTAEDSLQSLGLDPADPADGYIFSTIRWDLADDDGDTKVGTEDEDGGDFDYRLEIPLPDGTYDVRLYFAECCCPQRHFKVELQGTMIDSDVTSSAYAASGALGRTGFYASGGVSVTDGVLRIGLLPCPECVAPGAPFDGNAILNALEVLPSGARVARCPNDLRCALGAGGAVTCAWTAGENVAVSGYEIYRDGAKIAEAGPEATSFTDAPLCRRATVYEVVPKFEGASPCPGLNLLSTVVQPDCRFVPPVRVNMGGWRITDSAGTIWLGDQGEGADVLSIRPNDAGGVHAAEYWGLAALQRPSLDALGFDGAHLADLYLLSTIRWDEVAPPDFIIELAVQPGTYTVNLYQNEGFWNPPSNRHFRITIQDEVVVEDYFATELGLLEKLSFAGVDATGGLIRIGLLPITPCPAPDCNPILEALELIPESLLNAAPTASIRVSPEGPVKLSGGAAEVTLDGSASTDGDGGSQGLAYSWTKVSGPAGDAIESPSAPSTRVVFTADGTYRYRLTVDDGGAENATAEAEVEVVVLSECTRFVRGDPDSTGGIDISDGIFILGYLFLGSAGPKCADSADADDNGALELTDAVYVLNWLFLGGPAPKPPSPSSGTYLAEDCDCDPPGESLGCAEAGAVCR